MKKLALLWQDLPANERLKYEESAEADKARYESDIFMHYLSNKFNACTLILTISATFSHLLQILRRDGKIFRTDACS